MKYVGQSVRSLDADEKVTGTAVYTADLTLPGMKFARVVCSPHAHARIDGFDLDDARAVEGVRVIVTHDSLDLSRMGCLRTLKPYGQAVKDRPALAHEKVRFQGEPVAIVVADSETAAVEAAARVGVRYTPLPQVSELKSAMEGGTTVHDADAGYDREGEGDFDHDYGRNNCGGTHFVQGDPEQAFREAAHVIEDRFTFPSLFHYPMEPHCAIATVDDQSVTVHTSSQAPFPVRDELARMFGLDNEQVIVKVPYVGGGFGSKGHICVEHLAILAAAVSGATVQLRMSMEETAFTARRHPAEIEIRTGLREDGTLLCREAKIYLDTGAYADFGIQVTRKAAFRSVGPYRVEHARADCYSVYTNKVPAGAFRGIGSVQLGWACEAHTDHICTELGYDPIEFRLKNLLRAGEKYILGGPPLDGSPHAALTACQDLFEKTRRARAPESLAQPGERIGTGVACAIKDLSTTQYNARIVFEDDATFTVHANAPEIGGGAKTVLAQTAAEALGVSIDRITIAPYDTSTTPGASGVYGSRITVLMGNAVKRASEELRELLLQQAASLTDRDVGDLSLEDDAFSSEGESVMTLEELGGKDHRHPCGPRHGQGSHTRSHRHPHLGDQRRYRGDGGGFGDRQGALPELRLLGRHRAGHAPAQVRGAGTGLDHVWHGEHAHRGAGVRRRPPAQPQRHRLRLAAVQEPAGGTRLRPDREPGRPRPLRQQGHGRGRSGPGGARHRGRVEAGRGHRGP